MVRFRWISLFPLFLLFTDGHYGAEADDTNCVARAAEKTSAHKCFACLEDQDCVYCYAEAHCVSASTASTLCAHYYIYINQCPDPCWEIDPTGCNCLLGTDCGYCSSTQQCQLAKNGTGGVRTPEIGMCATGWATTLPEPPFCPAGATYVPPAAPPTQRTTAHGISTEDLVGFAAASLAASGFVFAFVYLTWLQCKRLRPLSWCLSSQRRSSALHDAQQARETAERERALRRMPHFWRSTADRLSLLFAFADVLLALSATFSHEWSVQVTPHGTSELATDTITLSLWQQCVTYNYRMTAGSDAVAVTTACGAPSAPWIYAVQVASVAALVCGLAAFYAQIHIFRVTLTPLRGVNVLVFALASALGVTAFAVWSNNTNPAPGLNQSYGFTCQVVAAMVTCFFTLFSVVVWRNVSVFSPSRFRDYHPVPSAASGIGSGSGSGQHSNSHNNPHTAASAGANNHPTSAALPQPHSDGSNGGGGGGGNGNGSGSSDSGRNSRSQTHHSNGSHADPPGWGARLRSMFRLSDG